MGMASDRATDEGIYQQCEYYAVGNFHQRWLILVGLDTERVSQGD